MLNKFEIRESKEYPFFFILFACPHATVTNSSPAKVSFFLSPFLFIVSINVIVPWSQQNTNWKLKDWTDPVSPLFVAQIKGRVKDEPFYNLRTRQYNCLLLLLFPLLLLISLVPYFFFSSARFVVLILTRLLYPTIIKNKTSKTVHWKNFI